jgi:hypothetical protein
VTKRRGRPLTKAKLEGLFADELALLRPSPGSLTGASSNLLVGWLRQIDRLRRAV